MINGNQFLIDLIGNNWMVLIIVYGVFRAALPNSRILSAIGEGFSNLFPVLQRKSNDPKN